MTRPFTLTSLTATLAVFARAESPSGPGLSFSAPAGRPGNVCPSLAHLIKPHGLPGLCALGIF